MGFLRRIWKKDERNESQSGRPQRPRRAKYDPGTRVLFGILGVLCVVLVAALVWQEYYESHTYRKGELALATKNEEKQRLRFMTEAPEELAGNEGQEAGADGEEAEKAGQDSGQNGETDGAGSQEAGENGEMAASGSQEDGADSETAGSGGDQPEGNGQQSGTGSGQGQQDAAQASAMVVETKDSVNLKNQLAGVLPGIQKPGRTSEELIAEADRLAAMYDYDGAIGLLKSCATYEQDFAMRDAVAEYETQKAACVEYPADQVTHIFFHTLIKDPELAFDGDQYEDGYNQYMVTISEFNSIIQQMYERGYVMVTLEDVAPMTVNADGTYSFERGKIMLPEGKKPFVLSQDDVSYYHYMDGDGFASRLIVDENGDIKNEYIEQDGTVSVGDYDMVPLIDRFVEEHPDFSYRGAKGYIALTGYDGILGYRTDLSYKTRENLDLYQEEFFEKNPDFDQADYEWECEQSKKVAQAMKDEGWLFASHTWGHVGLGEGATTFEQFKADTDKWEERVEPLIGETDTLIYAFGGDIGGVEAYSGQRFEYLKSMGFRYFCGVDSAQYWMQMGDDYVRQARRNLDGYRMYYNPEMLTDLFDVEKAWDPKRPSSVPPI